MLNLKKIRQNLKFFGQGHLSSNGMKYTIRPILTTFLWGHIVSILCQTNKTFFKPVPKLPSFEGIYIKKII